MCTSPLTLLYIGGALGLGNFTYQFFTQKDYRRAIDLTWFQGGTLFAVYLLAHLS